MMSSANKTSLLHRFLRNKRGNFSIAFAFTAVVIFLSVGLAVDFSRSFGEKTRVNNALDSASLATARALSIGEVSEKGDAAENYFKAIFAANLGIDDLAKSDYTVKNFKINTKDQTVSATADYDQSLTFMRVGSNKTTQVVASKSAASYGIGSIEVAMVMDVTGSMEGYNIKSLKAAAKLGVTELLSANTKTDEYVRVSLVPYSDSVNAGPLADYVYPDYLDAKSDAPVYDPSFTALYDVDDFQEPYKTDCEWVGYDAPRPYDFADYDNGGAESYLDHVTFAAFPAGSDFGEDLESDFGEYLHLAAKKNKKNKNKKKKKKKKKKVEVCYLPHDFVVEKDGTSVDDCATDRKAPTSGKSYQYTDANPGTGMISRDSRLGENTCTSSPIVPLTSSETTLTKAVNALSTDGCTAGHIGLQWAWYTISKNWADYLPVGSKPGDMSKDDDLAKYIILMTDGAFNTAYAGSSNGKVGCNESSLSNKHTAALCTNIKAAGIKIFTVGFGTSNSADKILEACASPDEGTMTYSYEPNNASELKATYQQIASLIQSLRLTQ